MKNVDVENETHEFETTTRYDGVEPWRDMNSIYYIGIFLPSNDNTNSFIKKNWKYRDYNETF